MIREDVLARAALVGLSSIGPNRIRWLLSESTPVEVLDQMRAGAPVSPPGRRPPGVTQELLGTWTRQARETDLAGLAARLGDLGVVLLGPGDPRWPFADDPEPPLVLFCQGEMSALQDRPRVALVGTRRCSAIGRQVAFRFGRELAEAGVAVVSGLATGVDGAAHRGTLEGGGTAVAVVGTGLDVVYPKANRQLWDQLGREGLLLSEAPLGARAERWRFPARNRLIAGLADVVVVVESHERGGALLTAAEAADRGCPVMAVPGAVTSSASIGSNLLLVDGCPPACCIRDITGLLQLAGHKVERPSSSPARPGPQQLPLPLPAPTPLVSALGRRILREVTAGAVAVDALVGVAQEPVRQVMAEIHRLESLGLVVLDGSTVISA